MYLNKHNCGTFKKRQTDRFSKGWLVERDHAKKSNDHQLSSCINALRVNDRSRYILMYEHTVYKQHGCS